MAFDVDSYLAAPTAPASDAPPSFDVDSYLTSPTPKAGGFDVDSYIVNSEGAEKARINGMAEDPAYHYDAAALTAKTPQERDDAFKVFQARHDQSLMTGVSRFFRGNLDTAEHAKEFGKATGTGIFDFLTGGARSIGNTAEAAYTSDPLKRERDITQGFAGTQGAEQRFADMSDAILGNPSAYVDDARRELALRAALDRSRQAAAPAAKPNPVDALTAPIVAPAGRPHGPMDFLADLQQPFLPPGMSNPYRARADALAAQQQSPEELEKQLKDLADRRSTDLTPEGRKFFEDLVLRQEGAFGQYGQATPSEDVSRMSDKDLEQRAIFETRVGARRKLAALAEGQAQDTGAAAGLMRMTQGQKPSEFFPSPETLSAAGVPVQKGFVEAANNALDPTNMLLAAAPGLPGARTVAGAGLVATGRTLEFGGALASNVLKKTTRAILPGAGDAGTALAVGGASLAIAKDPETALRNMAFYIGARGLRGVGGWMGDLGSSMVRDIPTATATRVAVGRVGSAGNPLARSWPNELGLMGEKAVEHGTSGGVGFAPFNYATSDDPEQFVANTVNASIFGAALSPTHGLHPELTRALVPVLREQGASAFDSPDVTAARAALAGASGRGQVRAQRTLDRALAADAQADPMRAMTRSILDAMPEDHRNAVLELAGVLSGMPVNTPNGQTTGVRLDLVNGPTFVQMAGGSARGYYNDGAGHIVINADSPAHASATELTHTMGHEGGGHAALNILDAISSSTGPLASGLRDSLARQVLPGGQPTAEYARFVDSYKAAIPDPRIRALPTADPYFLNEFLAETSGQTIARKGVASVILPPGMRDTVQQAAGDLFGRILGLRPARSPGGVPPKFNRTEIASVTTGVSKMLQEIAAQRFSTDWEPSDSDTPAMPGATTPASPARSAGATPPAAPPPSSAPGSTPATTVTPPTGPQGGTTPVQSSPVSPLNVTDFALARDALVQIFHVSPSDAEAMVHNAQGATVEDVVSDAARRKSRAVAASTTVRPSPAVAVATPVTSPVPGRTSQITKEGEPDLGRLTQEPPDTRPAPTPGYPDLSPEDIEARVAQAGRAARDTAGPRTQEKKRAELERAARINELLTMAHDTATDPHALHRETDQWGDITHRGRIDLAHPVHQALLRETGISPEGLQNFMALQANIGQPVYLDSYRSAPQASEGEATGAGRAAEQAASPAGERAEGGEAVEQHKTFVPLYPTVTKNGSLMMAGFSPDKVVANMAKLIVGVRSIGETPGYTGVNDPNIAADMQAYAANHAHGYTGQGKPILAEGITPDPNYTPVEIPPNRFDMLNAAIGDEGATEADRQRRKTPKAALKQEEARGLAGLNDIPLTEGDPNPLRARLNAAGFSFVEAGSGKEHVGTAKVLERSIENVRPDLIGGGVSTESPGETVVRPTGATEDLGEMARSGLPVAKFVRAGFMPEEPFNGLDGKLITFKERDDAIAALVAAVRAAPEDRRRAEAFSQFAALPPGMQNRIQQYFGGTVNGGGLLPGRVEWSPGVDAPLSLLDLANGYSGNRVLPPDGAADRLGPYGALRGSGNIMMMPEEGAPVPYEQRQGSDEKSRFGPGFYSAVERAVVDKLPPKFSGEQGWNTLKNAKGIKAEELEFTGVEEWLKSHDKPIAKKELQDYLRETGVSVSTTEEQKAPKWVLRDDNGDTLEEFDSEADAERARDRYEESERQSWYENYAHSVDEEEGEPKWVVSDHAGKELETFDDENDADAYAERYNEHLTADSFQEFFNNRFREEAGNEQWDHHPSRVASERQRLQAIYDSNHGKAGVFVDEQPQTKYNVVDHEGDIIKTFDNEADADRHRERMDDRMMDNMDSSYYIDEQEGGEGTQYGPGSEYSGYYTEGGDNYREVRHIARPKGTIVTEYAVKTKGKQSPEITARMEALTDAMAVARGVISDDSRAPADRDEARNQLSALTREFNELWKHPSNAGERVYNIHGSQEMADVTAERLRSESPHLEVTVEPVKRRDYRTFAGGHFEPDTNVHTREQDFEGTDGASTRLIEELQSDLHQQARDLRKDAVRGTAKELGIPEADAAKLIKPDYGYAPQMVYQFGNDRPIKRRGPFYTKEGAERALNETLQAPLYTTSPAEWEVHQGGMRLNSEDRTPVAGYRSEMYSILDPSGQHLTGLYATSPAEAMEMAKRMRATGYETKIDTRLNDNIPDAPFKKSYPDLAIKKALYQAAKDGMERLAWTVGMVHINRYEHGLRKAVDKIEWTKDGDRVTINATKGGTAVFSESVPTTGKAMIQGKEVGLRDIIGAKMTDTIAASPNESGSFEGDNIAIGGEGFQGFYDDMLPKIVGPLGGKVAQSHIATADTGTTYKSYADLQPVQSRPEDRTRLEQAFEDAQNKMTSGPMSGPEATQNEAAYREASKALNVFNEATVDGGNYWYLKHPDGSVRINGIGVKVFETEQAARDYIKERRDVGGEKVWSVDITPAMRAKILNEGLPIFMPEEGGANFLDLARDRMRKGFTDEQTETTPPGRAPRAATTSGDAKQKAALAQAGGELYPPDEEGTISAARSVLGGADQGPTGGDRSVVDPGIRNDLQARRFNRWAVSQGLYIPSVPERSAWGAEHDVWHGPDGRIFKATRDGFGLTPTGPIADELRPWRLGPGGPADYLDRLALSREVYGDEVRLEGSTIGENGVRIVTSQKHIVGTNPTDGEIANDMRNRGFVKVYEHEFYDPVRNIAAFDARPANFKKADDGGIYAIDVVLSRPAGALREQLAAKAKEANIVNYEVTPDTVERDGQDIAVHRAGDGRFGSTPDDRRLMPDDPKDFVAVHNTNADGVLASLRMGGIPAPSIAVLKRGLDFNGYGDISLVARPSTVDPEADSRNQVFDSDIYSPRQPKVTHEVNKRAMSNLISSLDDGRGWYKMFSGESPYDVRDWVKTDREGNRAEALRQAERSYMLKTLFLESKGVDVGQPGQIPRRPTSNYIEIARTPEVQAVFQPDGNVKPGADVGEAVKAALDRVYNDKEQARDPKLRAAFRGVKNAAYQQLFNEDGTFSEHGSAHWLMNDASHIARGTTEPDRHAFEQSINDKLAPAQGEFSKWVEDKMDPLFGAPYVRVGKKKVPYDIENVLAAMTPRSMKAVESTMTTGLGWARAKGAKRFDSLEAMREDAGRIVPAEDFSAFKDALNKEFFGLQDSIASAYAYHNQFDALDDASKSLASYLTGRQKTPQGMLSALRKNGYTGDITHGDLEDLMEFAEKIKDAPTEYFEAKPRRIVPVGEFAGAAVPIAPNYSADPASEPKDFGMGRIADALETAGVRVERYDDQGGKDPGARARAIDRLAKDNNLAFMPEDGKPFKMDAPYMGGGERDPRLMVPGVWMTRKGTIVPIETDHESAAREIFKPEGGEMDAGRQAAYAKGWVRVTIRNYDPKAVMISGPKPTPTQMRNIKDWAGYNGYDVENYTNRYQFGRLFMPDASQSTKEQDDLGFRSGLLDLIQAKVPNRASPEQILATLKSSGAKQEEMDLMGLPEWLKSDSEPVTKQALSAFVRAGGVQVKEVQLKDSEERQPTVVTHHDFQWSEQRAGDIRFNSHAPDPDETVVVGRHPEHDDAIIIRKTAEDDHENSPYVAQGGWGDVIPAESVQDGKDIAARMVQDEIREREQEDDLQSGAGETLFKGYSFPGGKNYREVLLTLPVTRAAFERAFNAKFDIRPTSPTEKAQGVPADFVASTKGEPDYRVAGGDSPEAVMDDAFSRLADSTVAGNTFKSSHWPKLNVVAHFRQADHRDTDGASVRLIEEIQSDWHQKGRKGGYKQDQEPLKAAYQEELKKAEAAGYTFDDEGGMSTGKYIRNPAGETVAMLSRHVGKGAQTDDPALQPLVDAYQAATRNAFDAVPDAPFKKSWAELAFKRALRMAVEDHMDKIAWTTGDQQAERYDLSKQLDSVRATRSGANDSANVLAYGKNGEQIFSKQVPFSELAATVGKELADKIASQQPGAEKKYTGLDLKVGGEGMRGFYDKILPDFVRKYVKRWGATVDTAQLATLDLRQDLLRETRRYGVDEDSENPVQDLILAGAPHDLIDRVEQSYEEGGEGVGQITSSQRHTVHAVEITPEMRRAVMAGQPMFMPESPASTMDRMAPQPESAKIPAGLHRKEEPSSLETMH